jgi:segregation and condensation protein A
MEETPIGDPNSNGYEVDLPDFQGPLDLLLSLIEQEELDITKISLARVTDQYLARLEILKETDPDDLTLIEEDQEDVGDELARQLMLYKKFKEIATHLQDIESEGRRSFIRMVPNVKVEPRLVPGDGNLEIFLEAARQALSIKPQDPDVDDMVSPEIVTLGQQMVHIWQEIGSQQTVSFKDLLSHSRTRLEVIVTLLAILELIKRNVIKVDQPRHFDDIVIEKRKDGQELDQAKREELLGLIDVS